MHAYICVCVCVYLHVDEYVCVFLNMCIHIHHTSTLTRITDSRNPLQIIFLILFAVGLWEEAK